ncbi:MAG: CoA-transferase, partial [Betaproteobacteria bacterium]
MINKQAKTVVQAIGNIDDGATIMVGGFGTAGIPDELIDGLLE